MKDADCIYKANGRAASCIHEAKVGVAEFDFTLSIGRDTILEGCTQQITTHVIFLDSDYIFVYSLLVSR